MTDDSWDESLDTPAAPPQPASNPNPAARRRTRIVLTCAGILLVLLVAMGPLTLAFPASCGVCHQAPAVVQDWRDSAHRGVECAACHTNRGTAFGLGNSLRLAADLSDQITDPDIKRSPTVDDEACRACHDPVATGPVVRGGLKMSHTGLSEAGMQCVVCHADTTHALPEGQLPQPTMSLCAGCHNNVDESGECGLCHVEGGRNPGEARRVDAEWSRTHGENWRALHGMGDLQTCSLCHPSDYCVDCHGLGVPHDSGFGAEHGDYAKADREPCVVCHTTAFCDSCHGIEMPHPVTFLSEHSGIADGLEDPGCLSCHTTANCNECHERHTHPGRVEPYRAPEGRFEEVAP